MGPARNSFALWTSVKIVGAIVAIFILMRIIVPNLVNAHNTSLLLLAIVCGVVALGIAIWTALSVRRAYRRQKRTGANLIEVRK